MKTVSLKRVGPLISVRFFDRMVDRQTRQLSIMLQRSIAEAGGRVRLLLVIAIVGRKSWERTYLGLFSLFSGVEIDYFDRSDAAKAIRWSLKGRRRGSIGRIPASSGIDGAKKRGKVKKLLRRWFPF